MKSKEGLRNLFNVAIILGSAMMVMHACDYKKIEVDELDPGKIVSFSTEVVTIFNNNDNCTSCHRPGRTQPDLTTDNAYNSIVPRLVNLADPESSKIYDYPHPISSGHGYKKYNLEQASLVLAWIRQGAENN